MPKALRAVLPVLLAAIVFAPALRAAASSAPSGEGSDLRLVIVLGRHGVRAPIGSEIRDNAYNADPWPQWPVAPGVLTAHGATLLRYMGAYYRQAYRGLLGDSSVCAPEAFYIAANNAQRTLATAQAIAEGLAPGCALDIHSHPKGEADPLFNPGAFVAHQDRALAAAAISGRLGGHPEWWPHSYQRSLEELEQILSAGRPPAPGKKSLLDAPQTAPSTMGGDLFAMQTPVSAGADFAEHFLLQYTEGMPMSQVGWGRVSRPVLDDLMGMNTRYHDFVLRTPYLAQVGASHLADHIDRTLRQAAAGQPVDGALGSPAEKFVFLSGHDSNETWLGGLLRLNWLLPDQPFDATPPGSALVFELHQPPHAEPYVRAYFISATLDQMRNAVPLTEAQPPSVAPIFIPGCSRAEPGYPCPLSGFHRMVGQAIDPAFTK
ncbi:histidine-type phosphatase [Paracidobacterium acidisoli]|nr:histidine-type phosphatase [Paracidobacterium acidisoli]MBT9329852.1 histidine-type phosphatase [Paracidobacterium acidisoli]